ncbi:hypothetical protein KsCSTR_32750 [Candidatus Kuenenia stuttgartiensis]|uniref:Uncharacterized protein n=1 Tax=Kuenenia stuttgartiensis TaxID=174633 RepID=Q1Q4L3_KUEST|nr:hypothetical protein KsCSTR_32750 [Candidatus Kuenenia stuttgartiensis]CAJ74953.1 unknown protein [Candidatus Kuenenia stuttgartiensis]
MMIKFKRPLYSCLPRMFQIFVIRQASTLTPKNSNLQKILFVWLILSCYEYQ